MNKQAKPMSDAPFSIASGGITQAAIDVLDERQRQVRVEGWTPEHDDEHSRGSLAWAAAAYAVVGDGSGRAPDGRDYGQHVHLWPWDGASWKPRDTRRNLVKAGALIIAEIERLDRAALPGISPEEHAEEHERQAQGEGRDATGEGK